MNIKITILILLSVGLLTSCEYAYTYSYSVTNSSDTTIDIKVKTLRVDSVFKVTKDETKILFMKEHGIEGAKGPYPRDVNKDLNIFTVTKGQAQSKRDYLKNINWTFEKGVYSTIITNDEF
ncbi:MAG: hypothetical protein ABI091_21665 [Ferruginibacter sp.]